MPVDLLDCEEVAVRRVGAVSAASEYDRPAVDESADSLMSGVAVDEDSSRGSGRERARRERGGRKVGTGRRTNEG